MDRHAGKLWRALNWPNRISLLRLLLIAPFVVLIMNQNDADWPYARHAAMGVFLIMAVSDALDGFLARKLNARTRLGAILDPLADKMLVVFAIVLLSVPEFAVPGNRIHSWVVVAAVGKDLWVVIGWLVIYLATDRFISKTTLAGKASTFCICLLVPVVLVAPELEKLLGGVGRYIVVCFEFAVTGLCVLAAASYTRVGLAFILERQKPLEDEHSVGSKNQNGISK